MKPEYRIPSMSEIRDIPWNGYNAISTFSGGGGSSLGYRMAGFRVLWACEFIESARLTYIANKENYTIVDPRDIRNIDGKSILSKIDMDVGELDLLDRSPPCASFSTAGKRNKGWGSIKKYSGTMQRTDDLFFEFSRIVREIQPKVFVAENVSGLVKGKSKGYFIDIIKDLKSCGYNVEARLLNSKYLGVAQSRERIIFVGVRKDLNKMPCFPKPLPFLYTLGDALKGCPVDGYRERMSKYCERQWKLTRPGDTLDNGHILLDNKTSGMTKYRLSWDRVPPTVLSRSGATCDYYHPDIPMGLTIDELKRICSFPDDYVIHGNYKQQWERLGRAVPPIMMMHIANTIRDNILI